MDSFAAIYGDEQQSHPAESSAGCRRNLSSSSWQWPVCRPHGYHNLVGSHVVSSLMLDDIRRAVPYFVLHPGRGSRLQLEIGVGGAATVDETLHVFS